MAQGGTWGHNLALPPSTAHIVLPQPLALQGAGLGIRDAQGIELGNAWYFYTSCPPSGQCVVPKSPAEQGGWKIPPLPQGWQQGWLSVGTAAAHNHRGVLGRSPGVAWQWDTLAQLGQEPGSWWMPCPARRAVLFHLVPLPTLEFSFAPVIKTNGVYPAADTGLQGGRTWLAQGKGWEPGSPQLGCGTVALQEIPGLFLFLQCSAIPNQ